MNILPMEIDVSLNSLDDIVDTLRSFNDDWIFRGQSNYIWGLRTSLGRIVDKLSRKKLDGGDIVSNVITKNVISKFKTIAPLYGIRVKDNATIWDELILMQHYGVPTHLLDFTFAPFVALFFSVDETYNAEHSVIFCFNYVEFEKMNVEKLDLDEKCEVSVEEIYRIAEEKNIPMIHFDRFGNNNKRIYSQQGCMATCTPSFRSFEDILVTDYISSNPSMVKRIVYPSELRNNIHRELKKMNVVGTNIYPDAKGVEISIRRDALLQ